MDCPRTAASALLPELSGVATLVADDVAVMREILKTALRSYGVTQLYDADDGEAAVRRCFEYACELVFLDVVMPNKDGWEALAEIRAISPDTFVVMVSGHATEEDASRAGQLGADGFIVKPCSADRLEAVLETFLRQRT
jgi:two-component system chemotaxis response regulator CheY